MPSKPFWTLFVLAVIQLLSLTAQGQMKIGHRYKIKTKYVCGGALNLQYTENQVAVTKLIGPSRLKAALTPDSGGKVKVDFWRIDSNSDPFAGSPTYVNCLDSAANFYFLVSGRQTLADATFYRSIPYAVTEVGVVTIPFKYRFGKDGKPNQASTDFNAGVYVGRKWGRERFYHDKTKNHESAAFTIAAFAGPTKVDLTKNTVADTLKFKSESSDMGLSVGGGAMYSYRKFKVGLFAGWDLPVGRESRNWIYARRGWMGFGIGYNISFLGKSE